MKNSIDELKERKEKLKKEIGEMESLLSFENPRKSLGVITSGVSEKFLGKSMASSLGQSLLPIAGDLLKSSLKVGSINALRKLTPKKISAAGVGKGLLVAGLLVAAPIIARQVKKRVEHYRKRETAKSLSKLI